MATAFAGAAELKLDYGHAEQIAFRYTQGKTYEGTYGPRVMFTLVDGRKLWLDGEDASDVERSLAELGVAAGQDVRLTKIRMPRGGGHAMRVELPRDQQRMPAASASSAKTTAPAAEPQQPLTVGSGVPAATTPQGTIAAPTKYMAAYAAAIDTLIEARAYAQRKGLAIEVRCEDVRCLAATIMIDAKGGSR